MFEQAAEEGDEAPEDDDVGRITVRAGRRVMSKLHRFFDDNDERRPSPLSGGPLCAATLSLVGGQLSDLQPPTLTRAEDVAVRAIGLSSH
jgi:hypothetical protein